MFTARLLLAAVGHGAAFAAGAAPALSAATPTAEYCLAGQAPDFSLGFAALRERVGLDMGEAVSCEYGDPNGSGDTEQNTTTGLAFYRLSTNTPSFTDGSTHWALTPGGIVIWSGNNIDPPRGGSLQPSPPPIAWQTQLAADWPAQVIALVNQERASHGVAPLRENADLNRSAQDYGDLMARTGCYDHHCGPVPQIQDRDTRAGYVIHHAWGENIAASQQSPESVMHDWMNSPGHRANILSPDFNDIGVGVGLGGQWGRYWVQDFGS